MKQTALALILAGSVATLAAPVLAADTETPSVTILSSHLRTGTSPVIMLLRAEVVGMAPPLVAHWNLGNGQEWDGLDPPVQTYADGRYDVILTVTDAAGKVKRASVAIHTVARGCGGM